MVKLMDCLFVINQKKGVKFVSKVEKDENSFHLILLLYFAFHRRFSFNISDLACGSLLINC